MKLPNGAGQQVIRTGSSLPSNIKVTLLKIRMATLYCYEPIGSPELSAAQLTPPTGSYLRIWGGKNFRVEVTYYMYSHEPLNDAFHPRTFHLKSGSIYVYVVPCDVMS